MSKFTHVLSNENPTYNFIFKLIDPKLDPHFNLEELGSLTITPGTTLDDILGEIPTFAKPDIIEVQATGGTSETCAPCNCKRYQFGGSPAYC